MFGWDGLPAMRQARCFLCGGLLRIKTGLMSVKLWPAVLVGWMVLLLSFLIDRDSLSESPVGR